MGRINGLLLGLVLLPAAATAADGKSVYAASCGGCHNPGLAGAPKLGDESAWQPRLAKGAQQLRENAIQGMHGGQGVMPAKGGNPRLSDAEVAAAVDYMISQAR